MTGAAIEATGLGMKYRGRGRGWALRDCSFRLPAGRVCALVGPNGAGKSTLLALAAGFLRPSEGTVRVLGSVPGQARARMAFVAQDKPLYPQLTVDATLWAGAELNPATWDQETAERIAGDLPRDARVRDLSGGQRTRLALALALGKRPELLLLDEPMADLDPLSRHRLMGALMAEAAERSTTIVMSSHILTELEGVCDYLLLVDGGRVRLGGETEDLLAAHTLLTGPVQDTAPHTVVESRTAGRLQTALVRRQGAVDTDVWEAAEPSLEELLLAHLRSPEAPALLTPSAAAGQAVATV
ncbi:ABC transporter ATP-binding protein [Streptomyces sp. NBC_00264]|uniref:ABC transporter ATP-binding protein n=1 Tax=unclassified Streptomyces TaxID=2593676 RepID=UPI000F5BFA09|nr:MULTISPECIES: ABC transporter ATP-binding protein [unclassified Streptomyces]WSG52312.1 ABC transporter ATP-binding protein [Streptomyces sp. NBC_01732]MCX5161768.1 ABC transporter ATP-binding protein [Streptomyces sp. NBC_00305]MCX5220291.1 ABC transporter ATP-binding protein [Streptomyces sp. NBC_00264]RPK67402.1 Daunorubicin/doxorubicin resistance ATP-binding protein DrrA [Streptomyces sp. ADI95-17]WSC28755.1 ABC transporter ATP-binding protein [Streptomyces sp. NBC_01768]